MQIEQISIFMENKSGQLAEITSALSEADIEIRAMILVDNSDFGVLRMIVDDPKTTKKFLKHQGYVVSSAPVFMVEQDNNSTQIHDVLDLMNNAEINVEYMYAFANMEKNNTVMIFMVNNPEKAMQVLKQK